MSNNVRAARSLEEARASLQKQQHEITAFAFLTTMVRARLGQSIFPFFPR